MVQEFMRNNESAAKVELLEAPVVDDSHVNTDPSPEQKGVSTQASVIPDPYGRVFHPRSGGHTLISNLVLLDMQVQQAKRLDQKVPSEEIDRDTCPVGAGAAPRTVHCGEGSITPKDPIEAMKQPRIVTAYQTFCTEQDGVVVHTPDTDLVAASPPVNAIYRPDGTDNTKSDRQAIYMKVTLVDSHADGCLSDEYKLAVDDCKTAFTTLNDGCDTDTSTEKTGGTYKYRCLKYTLSGTGTAKYASG